MPTIAQTFDDHWREDSDTGCWIWLRARQGKEAAKGGGYGCFKLDGKTVAAHKFSYERTHGPVPEGLQVMHSCHNTLCVNPSHLGVGTNDENNREKAKAGRIWWTKLTPSDVRRIRRAVAAGALQREVAEEYDLHQADVSNVVRRVYWKHVE